MDGTAIGMLLAVPSLHERLPKGFACFSLSRSHLWALEQGQQIKDHPHPQ